MSDFSTQAKKVKARKMHYCDWCTERIMVGAEYTTWSGTSDGNMFRMKMHNECAKASEGMDWDDFYRYDMARGCRCARDMCNCEKLGVES